jgi:hypothetical protein
MDQYPNWEFAIDEESEDDQDENTLRPAENQSNVSLYVDFTVCDAFLADGRKLPALLEVMREPPGLVYVFVKEGVAWTVALNDDTDLWCPEDLYWLDEDCRPPVVLLSDKTIFPLTVVSRLPKELDGEPFRFTIDSNGKATTPI